MKNAAFSALSLLQFRKLQIEYLKTEVEKETFIVE